MQSVLSKIEKFHIFTDPFPHIVIVDALEEALCSQLIQEFLSLDVLTEGKPYTSNERFSYPAAASLTDPRVSSLWQDFIRLHTSELFLQQIIDCLGDQLLQICPSFEQTIGHLATLRAGTRKIDSFAEADVLLDAQICINAPVTQPDLIKAAHVDRPQVLFAGLYYLRSPQDQSVGGDLEIYRFKQGRPGGFSQQYVDHDYVERVKTVQYNRNVLVLFLNSIDSLHGVTVRSRTDSPRYFVNLIGEVQQRLFDYGPYQADNRKWTTRLKDKLKELVQV
jgi:hypothetical protein